MKVKTVPVVAAVTSFQTAGLFLQASPPSSETLSPQNSHESAGASCQPPSGVGMNFRTVIDGFWRTSPAGCGTVRAATFAKSLSSPGGMLAGSALSSFTSFTPLQAPALSAETKVIVEASRASLLELTLTVATDVLPRLFHPPVTHSHRRRRAHRSPR